MYSKGTWYRSISGASFAVCAWSSSAGANAEITTVTCGVRYAAAGQQVG